MPSKIGSNYKLRIVWDEVRHIDETVEAGRVVVKNRPHVENFFNSNFVQSVIGHVQNLCWTIQRLREGSKNNKGKIRSLLLSEAGSSRIFLDLTNTVRNNLNTGIQRVCLKIAEEGARSGKLTPVSLRAGKVFRLDGARQDEIEFRDGDIYVILDTFWHPLEEYLDVARMARARGALVATCFHDVLPLLHPEVCPMFVQRLADAIDSICAVTDICFGVSKVTVEDLKIVLARREGSAVGRLRFFHFHLGSDGMERPGDQTAAMLPDALTKARFFLSVGTIEPKKGYAITLDAFDQLWQTGYALNFAIVGKYGWSAEAIKARIEQHPRLNKNLFWFREASDAFLYEAYKKSYCFIQASVAEGFGIPVVEAARYGLPVIASDIDVFKEIAGDYPMYFESENAQSLAEKIMMVVQDKPAAKAWSSPSWETSMNDLHRQLLQAAAEIRAPSLTGCR